MKPRSVALLLATGEQSIEFMEFIGFVEEHQIQSMAAVRGSRSPGETAESETWVRAWGQTSILRILRTGTHEHPKNQRQIPK